MRGGWWGSPLRVKRFSTKPGYSTTELRSVPPLQCLTPLTALQYVIFTNRSEVVLRGPVNTVVAAQPCDKKKNEDSATPNQPCQDPNYRSPSSSPSNSVNGHANSAFDHGEDGVRLPMLSESDSGSMHHSMDTKFTNPTLKKHFTEKHEIFSSGKVCFYWSVLLC